MDYNSPIRRRELLAAGGSAAAMLTAGCSGSEEGTDGGNTDTPGESDGDDGADTEQQETPTQSEDDGPSQETDTTGGPLTAEWVTAYPDEITEDDTAALGDFALGEQRAYITADKGASVLAFDLADGERLWRWEEYVERPPPALTYHEAVGPVAVLRSQGNNGDVYALDAESGTVEWDYQREAVGSLVATATDQYVVAGSGTGMTVLDPADGSAVTEFGGIDGIDFGATKVDVDQSTLFGVDTFDNTITGYDLETGEQRWQVTDFEVDRTGEVSLIVVDGTVVGIDSNTVFGIDPQAGGITFQLDVEVFDQELVGSDTRAFFINESNPSQAARAVDVTKGTIDWEQTEVRARATTPALTGDHLLVNSGGDVTLLDAASGDIVQREFDPSSELDAEAEVGRVRFLGARGNTAAVTSRTAIYGLSIEH